MSFFKWLFADKPAAEVKAEAPKVDRYKVVKDVEDAARVKLEAKFKDDKERYYVEATIKGGMVYKTEIFEPSFYAHARTISPMYSENYFPSIYLDERYTTSKERAEQFVEQNNNNKLVRFGDEYVCPKTITKVRLVKV